MLEERQVTRLKSDLVRHATVSGTEVAQPMNDLDSRSEIHDLVVRFYREIVFDELLGPVFGEVAEVDWSIHIPKLIDFWCRVLLGQPGYDGYILHAHQEVHAIEAFQPELFDRWYLLFAESRRRRMGGADCRGGEGSCSSDGRGLGPASARGRLESA